MVVENRRRFYVLVDGMGGNMEFIKVTGSAGKPVLAKYGIIRPTKPDMEETSTAIMEMSQAAGITQVIEEERNPLYTTTYGVGEMIHDAMKKKAAEENMTDTVEQVFRLVNMLK